MKVHLFLIFLFVTVLTTHNLFIRTLADYRLNHSSRQESPKQFLKFIGIWFDNNATVFIPNSLDNNIRSIHLQGNNRVPVYGNFLLSNASFPKAITRNRHSTDFYWSDQSGIRQYNYQSNTTSNIAGNSELGFSGDNGPAHLAQVNNPHGLWLTTFTVLYVADTDNHRIRKITNNIITTVAGSKSIGAYSGDTGPATLAELNSPLSVYVDSLGKLYIADYGNHVIRLVRDDQDKKNPLITTIAGSPTSRYYNGDNLPATLATIDPVDVKGDSLGNIYFTDYTNNRIRIIETILGIISTVLSNEIIPASINHPVSLFLSTNNGNLYFVEEGGTVVRSLIVNQPPNLHSTGLLHSDQSNAHHQSISLMSGGTLSNLYMKVIAGTGTAGFSGDNNPASSALVKARFPWVDSVGNVYLGDADNYRIRKINSVGIISTFGGSGSYSTAGTSGPLGTVSFANPWSIVGDTAGTTLYISDQWYIWKYPFSNNIVSVIAGTATKGFSGDNGPAISAQLRTPFGIWLTTGNILYIADTDNHRIRRITSNIITTVVGSGTPGYGGDNNPAISASINSPRSVFVDSMGKLFLVEIDGYRIRMVNTNSIITTFAGTGTSSPYNGDNIPAITANLNHPEDIKGDSLGNIYVADVANCVVRVISNGIISTVFGTAGSCVFTGGLSAPSASIQPPVGIWIDSFSNNIYFSTYYAVYRSVNLSPTSQPSGQPSRQPTSRPVQIPTNRPSNQPSSRPTNQPTGQPMVDRVAYRQNSPLVARLLNRQANLLVNHPCNQQSNLQINRRQDQRINQLINQVVNQLVSRLVCQQANRPVTQQDSPRVDPLSCLISLCD
jgi:hypothetical protein